MNSGNFFLSELEEKKNCVNRVESRRWEVPATALESSVGSHSSGNCSFCDQVNRQKIDEISQS